ncbi:UNKNOWN [Stylonychia lemnae]|uniref:carbonic anhydrase n=1 Tax=Stylonychia lemnae TaxID=5949 RepID=A0A077ZTG6_STYLE|nr:UNKNOWN [Stylonychia lemnae]|eukprot:CDW72625.1 UNKNOWN [Stylonychia lemnae]
MMRIITIATIWGFICIVNQVKSITNYKEGGENWTEGWCAVGKKQSPIDIPTSLGSFTVNSVRLVENQKLELILTDSVMSQVVVEDLITTYEVPFTDGFLALWDENDYLDTYKLVQFHVHAPSEHTFDGRHYDLEIHFVHKHQTRDRLAVLSVPFDVEKGGNQANDFISSLKIGEKNVQNVTIPTMNLVKKLNKNKIFHYDGSLTTPPCNETVEWIVVNDPQPISSAQVKVFNDRWMNNQTFANGHGNNRIVQSLNQRYIYMKQEVKSSLGISCFSISMTFILMGIFVMFY